MKRYFKEILIYMLLVGVLPLSAITYEDAEDTNTDGWLIAGDTSGDVSVENVRDEERDSRVIELSGNGKDTQYKLGNKGGWKHTNTWNNKDNRQLKWSMKYNESFRVYVSISTENGNRYLTYSNKSEDRKGKNGSMVHHGLGENTIDGTWKTFTRDLESDWNEFVTDNPIISVNGFFRHVYGEYP